MAENQPLPTVTPEKAGIPSAAVAAFVRRLNADRLCMHSFLMIRGGRIAAEGYWKPFHAGEKHRMYSVSKSFTAIAVGLLCGEGRIALDDLMIDYFPERVTPGIHPYLARTTLRDMLMMASAHDADTYTHFDRDWIGTYFEKPVSHLPGRVFSYNTSCSNMLAAIVERVTGQIMMDYLRPRLLDPIGVSGDAWCVGTPDGHSYGGSGVICTPRDLAKVALVCMNHGRHEGRQLIPADYIDAATARQIDNSVEPANPEFQFGYGYQIWRTRHDGFAFRGMGGQLAIALPGKDFILVTTGDTQGYESDAASIYQALWREIYPLLSDGPLPPDEAAQADLAALVGSLSLPLPEGKAESPYAARVHGKTYRMEDNAMSMRDLSFAINGTQGTMRYVNAQGDQRIDFGLRRYVEQTFTQTNYFGPRVGTPLGKGYRAFAAAAWSDEKTLVLQIYLADDYFGNMRMALHFEDGEVTLTVRKTAEAFLNEYSGFASGETAG